MIPTKVQTLINLFTHDKTLTGLIHHVQEVVLECSNSDQHDYAEDRHYQEYEPHTPAQTIIRDIVNYYRGTPPPAPSVTRDFR